MEWNPNEPTVLGPEWPPAQSGVSTIPGAVAQVLVSTVTEDIEWIEVVAAASNPSIGGGEGGSLFGVVDVYDLATSPLVDDTLLTEYAYPNGFANRVGVVDQSGGTTNLHQAVNEYPLSHTDYLTFPGFDDSIDLEFDTSALTLTDRRVVSVAVEIIAHPNMVAGAHWEAWYMGNEVLGDLYEARIDPFTISSRQTRRIDYGEINPGDSLIAYGAFPFTPSSVDGFDSGGQRIKIRRTGTTNPNQRISRVRLRVVTAPETRTAFGLYTFSAVETMAAFRVFTPAYLVWPKVTGSSYLVVVRRANSSPGGMFGMPWVEGGRPLPDGSLAYPTASISGDGLISTSVSGGAAARLAAALGTPRNRGYALQPIVDGGGYTPSLDGQPYEFVSELPVWGGVDSGGQTLTTGAGGVYEWLRVVLRVDDPALLPTDDLTIEVRDGVTLVATATITAAMFTAAALLIAGQPTSPREIVARLGVRATLDPVTQYEVAFSSATPQSNPWYVLGLTARVLTGAGDATFGGETDFAHAGALDDPETDIYVTLATVIEPVDVLTAVAATHPVDGGSTTGARCAVAEIAAVQVGWQTPCDDPLGFEPQAISFFEASPPEEAPAVNATSYTSDTFDVLEDTHYLVHTEYQTSAPLFDGDLGVLTSTIPGITWERAIPPGSAEDGSAFSRTGSTRRMEFWIGYATQDASGTVTVTADNGVDLIDTHMHFVGIVNAHVGASAVECMLQSCRLDTVVNANISEPMMMNRLTDPVFNGLVYVAANAVNEQTIPGADWTTPDPDWQVISESWVEAFWGVSTFGRVGAPTDADINLISSWDPSGHPAGSSHICYGFEIRARNTDPATHLKAKTVAWQTAAATTTTSVSVPFLAGVPVFACVVSERNNDPQSPTSIQGPDHTFVQFGDSVTAGFETIASPDRRMEWWYLDALPPASESEIIKIDFAVQMALIDVEVFQVVGGFRVPVQAATAVGDAVTALTATFAAPFGAPNHGALMGMHSAAGLPGVLSNGVGWRNIGSDHGVSHINYAAWANNGMHIGGTWASQETTDGSPSWTIPRDSAISAIEIATFDFDPEAPGLFVEGFAHYEIQRADEIDPVFATVAYAVEECVNTWVDLEARATVESSYRVRIVRTDGTYSDWSPLATITRVQGAELAFTSNEDPDLSLAYPDTYRPPTAERGYEFLDADTVDLAPMMGRHGFHAEWPVESRGDRFTRTLMLNAKAQPAVTRRSVNHYRPLRDLSRAALPYVCVTDGDGGRWFANLQVPDGTVRQPGHMFFAQIGVVEVSDVPYPATVVAPEPPPEERVAAPLAWLQHEPAAANVTDASAAFTSTGIQVTFTPPSDTVVVLLSCTWLTPGGMGANQMRARWHDGTAEVADTACTVQNNACRYRHEMTVLVTDLVAGVAQTWTLETASDGTHAAGLKVGPDFPVVVVVWDAANSTGPNRIGYLMRDSGGGGATTPITSTTLVRQDLQPTGGGPNVFTDLPPFVAPVSGTVLVTMHCTAVTDVAAADDYFAGLWDIDTDAAVPGSACQIAGGAGSRRCHPHYRRIIEGLTAGQTYNWSYANRVSAGSNVVGIKYDVDFEHEGPIHMIVEALDI